MVTENLALTEVEKSTITEVLTSINVHIVSITKQILVVQQELSLLIGAPYSFKLLDVEKITEVKIHNSIIIMKLTRIMYLVYWRDRNCVCLRI